MASEVDRIATDRTLLGDKAKLGAGGEIGFVTRLCGVFGKAFPVVNGTLLKSTFVASAETTTEATTGD